MKGGVIELTGSLEDYLETIYQLVQKQQFARVKEIAKARGVKAGSVSQALGRLADLGLVDYVRREYVSLTALGEEYARRIFAKHQLLERFFRDILKMSPEAAEAEACAIEHSLSAEGMDRMVRFFEFLAACPRAPKGFLDSFHQCPVVHANVAPQEACGPACGSGPRRRAGKKSIADLEQGAQARIVRIVAKDAARQRLIGMGMLPNAELAVERIDAEDGSVWVTLEGSPVRLRSNDAKAVRVVVP